MKRKEEGAPSVEENTSSLSDVPPATAYWVDGRLTWASFPVAPPREPHAGTCACEACFAAWLADSGVKFY
jgi:hypothetical protein